MVALNWRDLFVLSGTVLIAVACVQTGSGQIAQQGESQSVQQVADSAESPVPPQEIPYYVCGKRGFEAHATSPNRKRPFNMGVSFVSGANGAPLSDVAVKVRRHGRVLLDFVASGPHCLFSAPEADYRIEGTWRGEMKFEIVQTGTMNAQIRW
jgi:hypothetical protein